MVGTPGSGESNIDPNTEYDPTFNTDSYDLSDMEPSSSPPEQTPAPQPRKKGKAKGRPKQWKRLRRLPRMIRGGRTTPSRSRCLWRGVGSISRRTRSTPTTRRSSSTRGA
ncbi:hypothetical protein AAHA92_18808 [Salvia divinorum]|uniref:Uncharacterized protein n=1 Tax=Salvia divinorum TaxID=28513 RepID=A0ABD1H3B1_SALDI